MRERLGFSGVRVHGVDAFVPAIGSRLTILLFRFAGGEMGRENERTSRERSSMMM
jgi:hypothetical protein